MALNLRRKTTWRWFNNIQTCSSGNNVHAHTHVFVDVVLNNNFNNSNNIKK